MMQQIGHIDANDPRRWHSTHSMSASTGRDIYITMSIDVDDGYTFVGYVLEGDHVTGGLIYPTRAAAGTNGVKIFTRDLPPPVTPPDNTALLALAGGYYRELVLAAIASETFNEANIMAYCKLALLLASHSPSQQPNRPEASDAP